MKAVPKMPKNSNSDFVDESAERPDVDVVLSSMLRAMERPAVLIDGQGRVADYNGAFEACYLDTASSEKQMIWEFLPISADDVAKTLSIGLKTALSAPDDSDATDNRRVGVSFIPLEAKATGQWLVTVDLHVAATRAAGRRLNIDPLTNLPNASFVAERLDGVLRAMPVEAMDATVFCVDLDHFDQINTDQGRAVGDLVLIEAARRLGRSVRASNILGRLSEDMFVVIVPNHLSIEQITAVASRLIANIAAPFEIQGQREPIVLTASVGIATAPNDGKTARDLLDHAQSAVGAAKRGGAGTYQFFENVLIGDQRERRSRVNRLRRGIEQGHLHLEYQPKVSLRTGAVVGAEALVRWNDPDSGILMPADFIQLAEDAGFIHEIGHAAVTESMETLVQWQEGGLGSVRLAINVSAREIARREYLDHLRDQLSSHDIAPDRLELEITESAVMERAEEVIASLRAIRDLGVHLTADDFGTGYASLSYLRNFPLDGIKIDTTFVADINEAADRGKGLAAAVIAVGHSLGMHVVAEGVETAHQIEFLRDHQCDDVQGYFISGPLSCDEFIAFARNPQVFDAP